MQEELLQSYKEQLPKYKRVSWLNLLLIFITIASFIISLIQFKYSPKNPPEYIYSIFLVLLVIFLIAYTYLRESKRYHRYGESIFYIHYAQQKIKEYSIILRESKQIDDEYLEKVCKDILDIVSSCFSLLTSKTCQSSIKSINNKGIISTFARNSNSNTRYNNTKNRDEILHFLDNNTDFDFIKKEYRRYFLSNNLKKLWKNKKYKNSSFDLVGDPKIKDFFGFSKVTEWNLDYISTLVVPIRYTVSNTNYYYYGFLCIDANSRNIFNKKIDPELAIVFADILSTFMTQVGLEKRNAYLEIETKNLEELLDEYTKPTNAKKRK